MRTPEDLSKKLAQEYGIPGIRYLDEGSRISYAEYQIKAIRENIAPPGMAVRMA